MEVVINYVDLSSGEQEDVLGMVDATSDKTKLLENVIALAHANSSSVLKAAESNINYLTAKLTKLRDYRDRYNALVESYHQCGQSNERAEIGAQLEEYDSYNAEQVEREITKCEVPLEDYTDKVGDITSGSFTYFLVGEEAGKIHVVHERHSMVNSAFDVILKRVGYDGLNTL